MSIKATLSSNGLEEVYTPPTLKEMCLYKCLTNKEILTKEVEVDQEMDGSEQLDWEKFRLKEPIQRELVEALLDAADKFLLNLTPKYEPVLAAIRMSQPEHLVKVLVNNTETLEDRQLELLISGGHVKSLDIHGCERLTCRFLDFINEFGSKLEYLRIGDAIRNMEVLVYPDFHSGSGVLRTPNLKTFIVSEIHCESPTDMKNFWRFLMQDFISNLEDLQISRVEKLQTLEFLEPAKTKLTSLTLTNCVVAKNPNAWASLFKLDKLRFLDVVGSSIGEALVGENVVQRLLTAMPNLTHLAVDPGLIKDIYMYTSNRGQRSNAKRLDFLAVMENEAAELRKAKLLANDVAYFGTVEGEWRILEFYSNRLNSGYFDGELDRLLRSLSFEISPWNTVTAISLLMKTCKSNGVSFVYPELFFTILKKIFTPDVAAKLGQALLDLCIEAMSAVMRRWSWEESEPAPDMISDAIEILMNLDGQLSCDHYVTAVPAVIRMMEIAMTKSDLEMEDLTGWLKDIVELLEKAVDGFPVWGITSFLVVIKEFKKVMASEESIRIDLVEIFSRLIASLRNLCLNSGAHQGAAFHSAKDVGIVMDLLKEIIIDRCLGLANRDGVALLDILKSTLQNAKLDLGVSGKIAAGLEKLLISVHSQWHLWKSYSDGVTTHYFQLNSIASLINYLECDPRFDYKAGAGVKEIMMKIK